MQNSKASPPIYIRKAIRDLFWFTFVYYFNKTNDTGKVMPEIFCWRQGHQSKNKNSLITHFSQWAEKKSGPWAESFLFSVRVTCENQISLTLASKLNNRVVWTRVAAIMTLEVSIKSPFCAIGDFRAPFQPLSIKIEGKHAPVNNKSQPSLIERFPECAFRRDFHSELPNGGQFRRITESLANSRATKIWADSGGQWSDLARERELRLTTIRALQYLNMVN